MNSKTANVRKTKWNRMKLKSLNTHKFGKFKRRNEIIYK